MDSSDESSLSSLLQKLVDETEGGTVEVGEVAKILRYRGYGPLLLIPSIFVVLPTGAIPGVPAVCGFLLALFSIQIALGREHPWLPGRLQRLSVPKEKLEKAIRKKKKVIRKVDSFLDQRIEFLTRSSVQRLTGLFIFILSLNMIFIGFIPFAPDIFALPVIFFALGYMAHDGLFVLLGFIFVAIAAALAPWLFTRI